MSCCTFICFSLSFFLSIFLFLFLSFFFSFFFFLSIDLVYLTKLFYILKTCNFEELNHIPMCENWRFFFSHEPINSGLFNLGSVQPVHVHTATALVSLWLKPGLQEGATAEVSPANGLVSRDLPQGVCTALSCMQYAVLPAVPVLAVYFDNNAPTIE